MEEFVTLADGARIMGVSQFTFTGFVKRGWVTAYRRPGMVRKVYSVRELKEFKVEYMTPRPVNAFATANSSLAS